MLAGYTLRYCAIHVLYMYYTCGYLMIFTSLLRNLFFKLQYPRWTVIRQPTWVMIYHPFVIRLGINHLLGLPHQMVSKWFLFREAHKHHISVLKQHRYNTATAMFIHPMTSRTDHVCPFIQFKSNKSKGCILMII